MVSVQERFTQALHEGARVWRAALERRLRDSGLTMAGWSVLAALAANPAPPSQRELARRLGVDGASLVATIDRLEAGGLVERLPSPGDRRVRLIGLTARGRTLAAEIDAFTAALRRDAVGRIDDARLDAAAAVLEELRNVLERP
jgi:MarR family transcriptional regulator for hemolysin